MSEESDKAIKEIFNDPQIEAALKAADQRVFEKLKKRFYELAEDKELEKQQEQEIHEQWQKTGEEAETTSTK